MIKELTQDDFDNQVIFCACGCKPFMNELTHSIWNTNQRCKAQYWVECLECGTKTRHCKSSKNALVAWNRKMKTKERIKL